MPTHDLALDCGSGGTRIWRRTTRGGTIERVAWPTGGKAPVLSTILSSTVGREAFAAALRGLPSPPFIGATAGIRHAMSTGVVTEDHVDALRALLPAGAVLAVLSPLDEARHELRALRQCYPDQSAAMLSLGGKSMQLGREGSLASLPFAMHLGSDMLEEPGVSWADDVDAAANAYRAAAATAVAEQGLAPLDGVVVGITDVVDVAEALGLLDAPPLPLVALVAALENCVAQFRNRDRAREGLRRGDVHLLARVLALSAVAGVLLAPSARFVFPSAGRLSWTEGFFLSAEDEQAAAAAPID